MRCTPRQLAIYTALLLALTLAGGCAPVRPWSESHIVQSAHYRVRTNTSAEVAGRIGAFMEEALPATCQVLDCPSPLPLLTVHAYASRSQYQQAVRPLGLTPGTTGIYSPLPPQAIHLPWRTGSGTAPQVTLLHEGVHQLIDRAFAFSVPAPASHLLPTSRQQLIGFPLWLNEGLACYMEGALRADGTLAVGAVNAPRLTHLQQLIRSSNCPPLRQVLSRPYGEPFSAADYAVAWGLVHSLRHAPSSTEQRLRRQRLTSYLAAAQRAFFDDPDKEFSAEFLTGELPIATLTSRWHRRLARRSLAAFEHLILGTETEFDDWEQTWRQEILQLRP